MAAKPIFIFGSAGSGINGIRKRLMQIDGVEAPRSLKFETTVMNMSTFDGIEDIISFIDAHKKLYVSDEMFVVKGRNLTGQMDTIIEHYGDNAIYIFVRRDIETCFDRYESVIGETIESSTIQTQIDLVNAKVTELGLKWVQLVNTDGIADDITPIAATKTDTLNPLTVEVAIYKV